MSQPDWAQLAPNAANHAPLSPVSFLKRAARIYPDKTAIIDGDTRLSYRDFEQRAVALAAGLAALGIVAGDTVAVLSRNRHEMLEARYGVPMAGAVMNPINVRLDSRTIAFILGHGQARLLIVDPAFADTAQAACAQMPEPPIIVWMRASDTSLPDTGHAYEDLLGKGRADFAPVTPDDEWAPLTLSYTSGTTGDPKGVVYHHRGGYLAAMSNAMAFEMSASSVYLWTLPMFHCDGWGYVWSVTAVGATHVCLPGIDAARIYDEIEAHGVTHLCGAPIVLNTLIGAFDAAGRTLSRTATFALGGAAPPAAVIRKAGAIGFDITHLYGLTETYGPAALCVRQPEWADLDTDTLAARMARQGVANYAIEDVAVLDIDGAPVARDGAAIGEICIRGHTVMAGYLDNPAKTDEAFADGWFHTGDLAVCHADGYVEIKDRAKDIIISGGENISSLEIESVLYDHPEIVEAAVVAAPDDTWGEVPYAFVTPRPGAALEAETLIDYCRQHLARFKAPKRVVFCELPKTATGKIRKNVLRESL